MNAPAAHPAELTDEALLAECDVRRQRRAGPGGQHRNKVETGVFLTHRDTLCKAQATEARSQSVNRRRALFRLRLELALDVRVDRTGGEPSARWAMRTKSGRIVVDSNHEDFPALVAEALDVLTSEAHVLQAAARRLRVTPSQLVRLLEREPRALLVVNRARHAAGLRPLV